MLTLWACHYLEKNYPWCSAEWKWTISAVVIGCWMHRPVNDQSRKRWFDCPSQHTLRTWGKAQRHRQSAGILHFMADKSTSCRQLTGTEKPNRSLFFGLLGQTVQEMFHRPQRQAPCDCKRLVYKKKIARGLFLKQQSSATSCASKEIWSYGEGDLHVLYILYLKLKGFDW